MAFDFGVLKNPWVLGGIVVGGAVLAFFVIPRLGGSLGATSASTSSDSAASGQPAITYEIEQQQYTPPGATPGTAIAPTPPGPGFLGPPASNLPPGVTPSPSPPPVAVPPPVPGPHPPPRPKQFVHPQAWPNRQSTLRGISQAHGVALSAIESYPENQYIKARGRGWNSTIYTMDAIRIG